MKRLWTMFLSAAALMLVFLPTAHADVLSNDYVDIKLGGYLKLDTYFNTKKAVNRDSPLWVSSDGLKAGKTGVFYDDGKTLGATVRASRLWLDVSAKNMPEDMSLKMHIETDFYGDYAHSATGPRLPQMALRHYFVNLGYKNVNFIAGQTWVIAAPLHPSSFDTLVLAGKGNLWQRLPQLSIKAHFDFAEKHHVKLAFGVMRALSAHDTAGALVDNGRAGEITGIPMVQGRIAYAAEKLGPVSFELGLSGSFHQEKYPTSDIAVKDAAGNSYTLTNKTTDPINSWLGAIDFSLKAGIFGFKGEAYYGQNLDTFWGNMVKWGSMAVVKTNGVNSWVEMESVKEAGGFVNFCLKPVDKVKLNLGAGMAKTMNMDDVYTDPTKVYKVTAASSDTKLASAIVPPMDMQMAVYGNVAYTIVKGLMIGYELQYMQTTYYDKYMTATGIKDNVARNLWNNLMVKYVF